MVNRAITNGGLPDILDRHVRETQPLKADLPRRVKRHFHGREVELWLGYIHHTDIEGYVPNLRLKYYLQQWQQKEGHGREPTTDEIYAILVGADNEESRNSRKPFQVKRIADSIVRNGVREPIIVYYPGPGKAELWDGNRRFFGTKHIMTTDLPEYIGARPRVAWVPAYVLMSTGDVSADQAVKHDILTECNFVEAEQIVWPAYVKAEQIYLRFKERTQVDPDDPTLSREVKKKLAEEYGLGGKWRLADRWIKMYDLALQFKEFHEEDRERNPVDVDLLVQDRFEYFDELSKAGVYGVLRNDPDARDEVFEWLWDGKFKAFPDVRMIPKILADPMAHKKANEPDDEAVKEAIKIVNANDPLRYKDKSMPNERIKQFAGWLDSFRREDYRLLDTEALRALQAIVHDVAKITRALLTTDQASEDQDSEEEGEREVVVER